MRINSLQKNVFELDANKSSCAVFKIFPDEAAHPPHPHSKDSSNQNVAISNLPRWISLSGGALLNSSDEDPFAITIVDFHWYIDEKNCPIPNDDELPNDLFSSSFIYDAYIQGSLNDLDLNKYRVGKSSYVNYDANRILKRELSWKQLLKSRPIPVPVALPIPAVVVKIEPVAQNEIHASSGSGSAPRRPKKTSYQFQNRTNKISAVAPVPVVSTSTSSATLPTGQNQVGGSSARAVAVTATSTETDEREVSPFAFPSSPSPPPSDSAGRKRPLPVSVPGSSNGQGFRKIVRIEYTHDDGQKMLDYICKNNMHPYTRGNQIWTEMYLDKVTDHTEQSMKEHFRKKVYPRMYTAYDCSAGDRKKFELAERAVARGKKAPIYIAKTRQSV